MLNLRRNHVRVVAAEAEARASGLISPEAPALFSPDGRALLYRRAGGLVARDLESGASILVARSVSGSFAWLGDGRVVFLDGSRVQVARPGGRPTILGDIPRVERFAISPDGRRVVYDRRCETFLLDRETGSRRRLSGHLFVPEQAWAPDGSYFVLQWAEECKPKTGSVWDYHSSDQLYNANGQQVGTPSGRGATWSRDSTLLFVYPHQTGSAVTGTQGLVAIDPRRRRESVLLAVGNAYSSALVGPGRWVVYCKDDHPGRVPFGDTAGGLYLARLAGD